MKRLAWLLAAVLPCLASARLYAFDHAVYPNAEPGLPLTGGTVTGETVLAEGYECTGDYDTPCSGPSVRRDFDGDMSCPYITDAAPAGTMYHPPDNFPGGTQTPADIVIRPGLDERTVVIDDYTQGVALDTVVAQISLGSAASANCTATWGSGWCDSGCTSNALTATSLATVLDACTGIDASASSATVRISIDPTEGKVRNVLLTESRAALTTVSTNTDGAVVLGNVNSTSSGSVRVAFGGVAATDAGLFSQSSSIPYLRCKGASSTSLTSNVADCAFQVQQIEITTANNSNNNGIRGARSLKRLDFASDWGIGFGNSTSIGTLDSGIDRLAAGILRVTNGTVGTTGTAFVPGVQAAATVSAPVTCNSTNIGVLQVVNDTNDAAVTTLCYCGQQADDSTYDWLQVADNAACPHY